MSHKNKELSYAPIGIVPGAILGIVSTYLVYPDFIKVVILSLLFSGAYKITYFMFATENRIILKKKFFTTGEEREKLDKAFEELEGQAAQEYPAQMFIAKIFLAASIAPTACLVYLFATALF